MRDQPQHPLPLLLKVRNLSPDLNEDRSRDLVELSDERETLVQDSQKIVPPTILLSSGSLSDFSDADNFEDHCVERFDDLRGGKKRKSEGGRKGGRSAKRTTTRRKQSGNFVRVRFRTHRMRAEPQPAVDSFSLPFPPRVQAVHHESEVGSGEVCFLRLEDCNLKVFADLGIELVELPEEFRVD